MPWPVHPTGFFGARGDQDSYRIERSLRFNSADSAYLNRTPASTTNLKTWTYSAWIKRSKLASASPIFFGWNGSNTSTVFQFTSTDTLELYNFAGAYYAPRLITNQVLRDLSAWYHIVLVWDANNVTSTDRQRIYINGVRITSFSTESYSNDVAYGVNVASYPHGIGGGAGSNFDGYMAEINFIDGQALTPSSFGETDAITGRWKAKAYSGTYGTNGFYLKFADNSGTTATTLGKDSSGNGNNWTPNNFSVTAGAGNDSLVDSPTNYGTDTGVGGEVRGNYCTLNPLSLQGGSLSNGNLDGSTAGLAPSGGGFGTWAIPSTGKWYWEFMPNDGNGFDSYSGISVAPASSSPSVRVAYYGFSGDKEVDGVTTAYGAAYGQNDIIGVAVNSDSGVVTFYKNGVSQGNITYSVSGKTQYPWFADGSSARNTSFVFNFGQRPFAYTAPAGFRSLCTTNLPQPTIQKPSKYMDVVTYTGTGASNSISSLGFSPDLVWIKNRGTTTSHAIYDTTRGTQAQLSSDTTGDEVTSSTGLTAFGSNGFTIGTSSLVNTSGTQYVAWAWDEAPIAGMDIVSYTGNGANRTIAHGLGVVPKMMIVKARVTASTDQGWPVYHTGVASDAETDYLLLNSTAAAADLNTVWNDTAPTSSVFSVGTNALVNTNNDTYIAYLFAEVEGFSKFGSYTGNGSADGPFVFTGFRPRWVLTKNSSGAADWTLYDSERSNKNVVDFLLSPNTNSGDTASSHLDILSSGFKLRVASSGVNNSGAIHVYAAFAESPFKYARAR